MLYVFDKPEVQQLTLNEAYRSMEGDPFLTSDFIYVDPFIKPLGEETGGYQLFLHWSGTVDDQFTSVRILEVKAIHAVFILPEGENDRLDLQRIIALSQEAFAAEVSAFCAGTPLKDFRFAEIEYDVIAGEIIVYLEKH